MQMSANLICISVRLYICFCLLNKGNYWPERGFKSEHERNFNNCLTEHSIEETAKMNISMPIKHERKTTTLAGMNRKTSQMKMMLRKTERENEIMKMSAKQHVTHGTISFFLNN